MNIILYLGILTLCINSSHWTWNLKINKHMKLNIKESTCLHYNAIDPFTVTAALFFWVENNIFSWKNDVGSQSNMTSELLCHQHLYTLKLLPRKHQKLWNFVQYSSICKNAFFCTEIERKRLIDWLDVALRPVASTSCIFRTRAY